MTVYSFFHKFKDLKFGHMYMYWYAIFLLSLCLRSGISQQRDIPNLQVIGLWTWPHSIILLWYYIKFFIKTNSVQQLIKSGLYLFTKFWLVSQSYHCVWYFFLAHLNWKLKWGFLITWRQSILLSIILSHHHFLKNQCANFKQVWHKTSFGKGDSSLMKWRAMLLSRGRLLQNSEIVH